MGPIDSAIKLGGEYISGILNAYSSFWVGAILGEVGKSLSQGQIGFHNLNGGNDFLGSSEIGTDINLLEKFYDSRNTFGKQGDIEVQNVARYKSIIEMYYGTLKNALKLLESNINSITKVKTITDLRDYKIKMMKGLKSLIKECNNVIGTAGFDSFRIEHITEFIQKLRDKEPQALKDLGLEKFGEEYKLEGINIQLTQETQKNLAKLKIFQLRGCGTFADFVVYLKETAEKSYKNLERNKKGECAIYISEVDGEFEIVRKMFDVKNELITKGRKVYFEEKEMATFKRDIGNKSREKSTGYVKDINKMYLLCVSVHDRVKKLHYKSLVIGLNLKCLEEIVKKLKEQLDSIHFFVFGANECLCSENKTFEDSGLTTTSELALFARKINQLFCYDTERALREDKKLENTIYVKKMCESLKGIYKRIKYLEKLSVELYKTALKIKKEYKSKMGKVKKLIARFSFSDIPFWFASKMMRAGESCEDSVKKAETLEKLTEALNEYIKYLERVNKFKKEILSKYIALEKIIKINKLDEKAEAIKKFAQLKEKIEKLNLRKDIDFSNFKKLLNEAKKAVNEEVKKARKTAKDQKKQNRSNSARGNPQPSVPAQ